MSEIFDDLRHNTKDDEIQKFYGNYRGIVIDAKDPEVKGRCKIFVPGVYPEEFSSKANMLPWAEPVMSLFGGSWKSTKSTDLNSECGYTSVPFAGSGFEGANVWVFFEAGDCNFPAYWGACQSGPGWLSEHHEQHVFKSRNVKVRIDENPLLPEKGKGKSKWTVKIKVWSPQEEATESGGIDKVIEVFNELDQRGEYVSELQAGTMTYTHGIDEPSVAKALASGASTFEIKYYKFQQVDELEKEFDTKEEMEAYISEMASIKGDNEIYESEIEETPIKEDKEKSTSKFNTYNDECVVQSKYQVKKKQPSRIDIEVLAPDLDADVSTPVSSTGQTPPEKKPKYGTAINLKITGDVNLKVDGDVFEHINGNKHETLSGNLYRRHVGNVFHRVEGNYHFTCTTPKNSNLGGDYNFNVINLHNQIKNNVDNYIGSLDSDGNGVGTKMDDVHGDGSIDISSPVEIDYEEDVTYNYHGGLDETVLLSHYTSVGVDRSEVVYGNKYTSVAKLNFDSNELLKFGFIKAAEINLNMGVYAYITLIGGLKVNGYFGVDVFGMTEIEICGLVKGSIAGTLNAQIAPIITHN